MKQIFTIILTLLICPSLSAAPLEKDRKERKPKKKRERFNVNDEELKALEALERHEGKSKFDD